jgi:hypothetical protein
VAYKFDIGATVRARAIVEPWVISAAAAGFWFVSVRDGLMLSYAAAMVGAFLTALIPMLRHYGGPHGWQPHPAHLIAVARRNAPLAAADAIEWGTRRLDLFILGQFTSPTIYGIYYMAQQVASLPQKLKTSFEPILGPVITRNLAENRLAAVAAQVSQVGFWIIAAQAGVALALGIPGEAVMGLVGPEFVSGTAALAFLLAAEVVAATAVVSEAALVYVARHRNLLISIATLALQAILSVDASSSIAKSMGLAADLLRRRRRTRADARARIRFAGQGAAARARPRRTGQQLALGARLGDCGRDHTRLWRDPAARMGRAADRRPLHPRRLCLADLDARFRSRRPGAVQKAPRDGRTRERLSFIRPLSAPRLRHFRRHRRPFAPPR